MLAIDGLTLLVDDCHRALSLLVEAAASRSSAILGATAGT